VFAFVFGIVRERPESSGVVSRAAERRALAGSPGDARVDVRG
jgi:hypothetical protein